MTFLMREGAPYYRAQLQARSFEMWRRAERLVSERWSGYIGADRETRAAAFAAYMLALSAEAAAADELELMHLTEAA